MTKRQKQLNKLTEELVEWGRENKVTCDEWHILMGRMNLHIIQYLLEPTYNLIYDAGKDKVSMKVKK